jgi:hypothetical protein
LSKVPPDASSSAPARQQLRSSGIDDAGKRISLRPKTYDGNVTRNRRRSTDCDDLATARVTVVRRRAILDGVRRQKVE